MIKTDEISNPNSCLNKALPQERLFVLTARDAASFAAIMAWKAKRLELGLNVPGDEQIIEATECALAMERERPAIREALGKTLTLQKGDTVKAGGLTLTAPASGVYSVSGSDISGGH